VKRGRLLVLGVIGWTIAFNGFIRSLTWRVYTNLTFWEQDWWTALTNWQLIAHTILLIGASVFLLTIWKRMRSRSEVVEDDDWRLASVVSFTLASLQLFFLWFNVVIGIGIIINPDPGGGMEDDAFSTISYIAIVELLIAFGMFLGIAIWAWHRIWVHKRGDPFNLEYKQFYYLLIILAVLLADDFFWNLGYFALIDNAQVNEYNIASRNASLFGLFHSTLMLGVALCGLFYFRSKMVKSRESMVREDWQELAFMTISLFILYSVYFFNAFVALIDTIFDQPDGGWSSTTGYILIAGGMVFEGLAFLTIGLFVLVKSRRFQSSKVKTVISPQ
jgi:hypothetical protein